MTAEDTATGTPPETRAYWNAQAYASNTGHHRLLDGWFLESTPLVSGMDVLDLGCGSGDFTRTLADLVAPGRVVGVDPSEALLDRARSAAGPNQTFAPGTAEDLVRAVGERRFDAVVSRAALHWVDCRKQGRALIEAHAVLRPGGFLRVEMGGAGNIARVVDVLNEISSALDGPVDPWCFPDPGWYTERLEEAGFDLTDGFVRSVAQRRSFYRNALIGWLESQVLNAYEASMPRQNHQEFRRRVRIDLPAFRRHDGSLDQTFVRLDVLATKRRSDPIRARLRADR